MKNTLGMMTIMALCALTQTAAAEAPATAGAIQLGGTLGYGLSLEEGDFNPLGLGLGVNGGITLDSGLYVGALFDYHL